MVKRNDVEASRKEPIGFAAESRRRIKIDIALASVGAGLAHCASESVSRSWF
jgi:hypothetical protein